jgi:hypothetical protein
MRLSNILPAFKMLCKNVLSLELYFPEENKDSYSQSSQCALTQVAKEAEEREGLEQELESLAQELELKTNALQDK